MSDGRSLFAWDDSQAGLVGDNQGLASERSRDADGSKEDTVSPISVKTSSARCLVSGAAEADMITSMDLANDTQASG